MSPLPLKDWQFHPAAEASCTFRMTFGAHKGPRRGRVASKEPRGLTICPLYGGKAGRVERPLGAPLVLGPQAPKLILPTGSDRAATHDRGTPRTCS